MWTLFGVLALGMFILATAVASEGHVRYLPFGLAIGAVAALALVLQGLVLTRRQRERSAQMTSMPPNCLFVGGPLDGKRLHVDEPRLARTKHSVQVADAGRRRPYTYQVRAGEGSDLPLRAE
jgi:hypothetical protein